MSAPNLNDLQTQSGGLHALLHMLYEASCDLDYASDNAPAVTAANRVNHLIILARDEAGRIDAAVGECIAADRQERGQAVATLAYQPNFEPSKLSLPALYSLYDALGTIHEVVNALASQPRFSDGKGFTPAGEMLDNLSDFFGEARSDIHDEARAREAVSEVDKQRKVYFLVDHLFDGFTSPDRALGGLPELKKELGKLAGGAK
jgi:hypothetical protein